MQFSILGISKWYHLSVEGIRKGYHFSQKWYGKGSEVGPRDDQIDRLRSYFNLLHTFATLISFLQENKFFPCPQGWA